jgi:hypothetical protein
VELVRRAGSADGMVMIWDERRYGGQHAIDRGRFGSAVLEKVVPSALGSEASYDISDDRVVYRINIPRSQFAR